MKRMLACSVIIALATPWLLLGQAQPQAAAPSKSGEVEKELIKLEDKWGEALVKSDTAFMDPVVADDYTYTGPEGMVLTKAQIFEAVKSGDLKITSISNDDYKVRVYGEAAVVTGRSISKGQFKGTDFNDTSRWTDTWVKMNGHWQCVASHASNLVEQK